MRRKHDNIREDDNYNLLIFIKQDVAGLPKQVRYDFVTLGAFHTA